jgi:hypothetical protein
MLSLQPKNSRLDGCPRTVITIAVVIIAGFAVLGAQIWLMNARITGMILLTDMLLNGSLVNAWGVLPRPGPE